MAHEIKETLYRVKNYSGISHYVECSSLYDLFHYLVKEWIMKGYSFSLVNRMDSDGSTPKIAIFKNKDFKIIKAQYQNFDYAIKTLEKAHYRYEILGTNCARVYFNDETGEYTRLEPCDMLASGYVMIEGRAQHIDDWAY